MIGTALIAGALLAFALSWDEIVVTYFTAGAQNTLPLLIFGFIRQGQNLPIVNAIALVVIVVSLIPVALAQRLTSDPGAGRGSGALAFGERTLAQASLPGLWQHASASLDLQRVEDSPRPCYEARRRAPSDQNVGGKPSPVIAERHAASWPLEALQVPVAASLGTCLP